MLNLTERKLIESYLLLGAPLDLEGADRYLAQLFAVMDSVEGCQRDSQVSTLLEQIVKDSMAGSGNSEIIIPLTGGLDSRGILGACLSLYGRSRIRCFTYGNLAHRDVRAARDVCARLGVEWQNVDLDQIEWSIPVMIEVAKQVKLQTGALCACGAVRRDHIESLFNSDAIFLTGFFGGSITGDWVSNGNKFDANLAVASFLDANALAIDGLSVETELIKSKLASFVESWMEKISEYRGLACGDILHFSLRQALNIKGSVCYFRNSKAPYEHPLWVDFWARQSLDDRRGRRRFRKELRAAYPEVFCLDSDRAKVEPKKPSTLVTIKKAGLSLFRPRHRDQLDFAMDMKGDIRENDSMRVVLSDLCDSFYERDILDNPEFKGLVVQVMRRPSKRTWKIIDRLSKAELHLRAGTLLPSREITEKCVVSLP